MHCCCSCCCCCCCYCRCCCCSCCYCRCCCCCCCCCWSLLYSAILRSRSNSLRSHVILHEWIAFYSAFFNIHSAPYTSLYEHCKRVCTEDWLSDKNPLPHRGLEAASVLQPGFAVVLSTSWAIRPHRRRSLPHFENWCCKILSPSVRGASLSSKVRQPSMKTVQPLRSQAPAWQWR